MKGRIWSSSPVSQARGRAGPPLCSPVVLSLKRENLTDGWSSLTLTDNSWWATRRLPPAERRRRRRSMYMRSRTREINGPETDIFSLATSGNLWKGRDGAREREGGNREGSLFITKQSISPAVVDTGYRFSWLSLYILSLLFVLFHFSPSVKLKQPTACLMPHWCHASMSFNSSLKIMKYWWMELFNVSLKCPVLIKKSK